MRLINADVVVENIDEWLDCVGCAVIGKGLSYYYELLGCIEDAPTVDAVEVVRCKDCKWFFESDSYWADHCRRDGKYRDRYDYCSRGERRDGD